MAETRRKFDTDFREGAGRLFGLHAGKYGHRGSPPTCAMRLACE
jgi:hypothetical protein